jgi:hypothetical protein
MAVGRKRSVDSIFECVDFDKKDIEISKLKKKCFELEQRLEVLEKNGLCKCVN